jgi:hypothetical protein
MGGGKSRNNCFSALYNFKHWAPSFGASRELRCRGVAVSRWLEVIAQPFLSCVRLTRDDLNTGCVREHG